MFCFLLAPVKRRGQHLFCTQTHKYIQASKCVCLFVSHTLSLYIHFCLFAFPRLSFAHPTCRCRSAALAAASRTPTRTPRCVAGGGVGCHHHHPLWCENEREGRPQRRRVLSPSLPFSLCVCVSVCVHRGANLTLCNELLSGITALPPSPLLSPSHPHALGVCVLVRAEAGGIYIDLSLSALQ